jgi:hypothetical protein
MESAERRRSSDAARRSSSSPARASASRGSDRPPSASPDDAARSESAARGRSASALAASSSSSRRGSRASSHSEDDLPADDGGDRPSDDDGDGQPSDHPHDSDSSEEHYSEGDGQEERLVIAPADLAALDIAASHPSDGRPHGPSDHRMSAENAQEDISSLRSRDRGRRDNRDQWEIGGNPPPSDSNQRRNNRLSSSGAGVGSGELPPLVPPRGGSGGGAPPSSPPPLSGSGGQQSGGGAARGSSPPSAPPPPPPAGFVGLGNRVLDGIVPTFPEVKFRATPMKLHLPIKYEDFRQWYDRFFREIQEYAFLSPLVTVQPALAYQSFVNYFDMGNRITPERLQMEFLSYCSKLYNRIAQSFPESVIRGKELQMVNNPRYNLAHLLNFSDQVIPLFVNHFQSPFDLLRGLNDAYNVQGKHAAADIIAEAMELIAWPDNMNPVEMKQRIEACLSKLENMGISLQQAISLAVASMLDSKGPKLYNLKMKIFDIPMAELNLEKVAELMSTYYQFNNQNDNHKALEEAMGKVRESNKKHIEQEEKNDNGNGNGNGKKNHAVSHGTVNHIQGKFIPPEEWKSLSKEKRDEIMRKRSSSKKGGFKRKRESDYHPRSSSKGGKKIIYDHPGRRAEVNVIEHQVLYSTSSHSPSITSEVAYTAEDTLHGQRELEKNLEETQREKRIKDRLTEEEQRDYYMIKSILERQRLEDRPVVETALARPQYNQAVLDTAASIHISPREDLMNPVMRGDVVEASTIAGKKILIKEGFLDIGAIILANVKILHTLPYTIISLPRLLLHGYTCYGTKDKITVRAPGKDGQVIIEAHRVGMLYAFNLPHGNRYKYTYFNRAAEGATLKQEMAEMEKKYKEFNKTIDAGTEEEKEEQERKRRRMISKKGQSTASSSSSSSKPASTTRSSSTSSSSSSGPTVHLVHTRSGLLRISEENEHPESDSE